MTFAEKLKELRDHAGLSQPALAERSCIPLATLRSYEQGRRRNEPSYRMVVHLAEALGVDCGAFRECVIDEPPTVPRGRHSPAAASQARSADAPKRSRGRKGKE
jgi:transcriptional regulator with XRE-family HTH domain